jgi:hypothetical protein
MTVDSSSFFYNSALGGGAGAAQGGAIYNQGEATVINSTFYDNTAVPSGSPSGGAGIYNAGYLTLTLLVIWFGPGMLSKVLICALIVFFPVLVNTVVGLHTVPEDLRDLMRSLEATRWQTFRLLEAPAALPVFLGGLRIGATLAVIGAVVGEFVGADRGLGFLINRARGQYDTALVFVGVLALVVMALSLYGFVSCWSGDCCPGRSGKDPDEIKSRDGVHKTVCWRCYASVAQTSSACPDIYPGSLWSQSICTAGQSGT